MLVADNEKIYSNRKVHFTYFNSIVKIIVKYCVCLICAHTNKRWLAKLFIVHNFLARYVMIIGFSKVYNLLLYHQIVIIEVKKYVENDSLKEDDDSSKAILYYIKKIMFKKKLFGPSFYV